MVGRVTNPVNVFHGQGPPQAVLSRLAATVLASGTGFRDLERRAFVDWTDAFETLAEAGRDAPLLLVLDEFPELRLLQRVCPVTENPSRTRNKIYRITDNFLAFWLGVVERYRTEIERGLGGTILPVLIDELSDFMGPRWEEAFRFHLRRLAADGSLGTDVVAIGPYWASSPKPLEIDAVVLAGRSRRATLVGEAKWARQADGGRLYRELVRKASQLPRVADDVAFAICAREEMRGEGPAMKITAADIFEPD